MADVPQSNDDSSVVTTTSSKRKAETDLERTAKKPSPSDDEQPTTSQAATADAGGTEATADQPLSKNQLKRLRRQQQWEEFKVDRRSKRKDKRHEKQARKRAEKEAIIASASAAGLDPAAALAQHQKEPWKYRPVPVAFILDCDFEQYMREPELVSLSSQIVRSYAMNRKGKYQASLHISSWKGKMRERFETVLKDAHLNWKNGGGEEGGEMMRGPEGGEVIDLIRPSEGGGSKGEAEEDGDVDQSVVYLTSESPYTLDKLEANTSYVIGGIVDKNREKGLCYNRAKEFKVRTAKLPIGEYMAMQSRYVLTTNQVVEIMAKWLECGDWGEAFLEVIPKRKGGTLKGENEAANAEGEEGEREEEEAAAGAAAEDGASSGEKAAKTHEASQQETSQ
ncbi:tRNA (guanine(9)-N(1))-methyltransferase [Collariella sp. IMI 366227]|nr:tRNA (guanine(9)-N(1))-methyltransferase [Collariella sp. IMI 366227]